MPTAYIVNKIFIVSMLRAFWYTPQALPKVAESSLL